MPDVPGPRSAPDHPDRLIQCIEALEPAFAELEQVAMDAGWTEDEVRSALLDLAKNGILAMVENRKTVAAIREAQDRQ